MYFAVFALLVLNLLHNATCLPNKDPEIRKNFHKWFTEKLEKEYENDQPQLLRKIEIPTGDEASWLQSRPGTYATQAVEEDEEILTVPYSAMISSMHVQYSDIGELVFKIKGQFGKPHEEYDPGDFEELTIYLLYEYVINFENSVWKPWLEMLPRPEDMNNILFWKALELKELKGSPLYERAVNRRADVTTKYDWYVANIFRPFKRIWTTEPTELQYKWAVSIVRSRNIQIEVQPGTRQPVIVPYFDMMRHAPHTFGLRKFHHFNIKTQTLTVRAVQSLKAGEEAFATLGEKCNSELLDFYGFVFEDNPNDCVHVELELSRGDPLFEQKQRIYRTVNPEPAGLKLVRNGISSLLLMMARLLTISEEELTNEILMGYNLPGDDDSLGLRSDLAVANYLLNICRKQYKSYPTTAEEDEELLKDEAISERKKLAVQEVQKLAAQYEKEHEHDEL